MSNSKFQVMIAFYEKSTIIKIRKMDGTYTWIRLPRFEDKFREDFLINQRLDDLGILMDGESFDIIEDEEQAEKWISESGEIYGIPRVLVCHISSKYKGIIPIVVYVAEYGICIRCVNAEKTKPLYLVLWPNEYMRPQNDEDMNIDELDKYLGAPRASITGLSEGKTLIINIPVIKTKDGQPLDNMPKTITTTNTETEIYDCSKNMRVNAIGKNGTLGNAYEEGVDFTFIDNKLTIHPKDNDEKWIVCYERTA